MHDKYFEGIVQLRNCSHNDVKVVRDNILQATKINHEKEVRGGHDFYVISKRPLRKLMVELKNKGCEVKMSKKLHTRDTKANKNIYRVSLLVRMPDVQRGDVVASKGAIIKVVSVSKKITGLDVKTGKRKTVESYDNILEIKEAVVSKTRPYLEIIHPDTFQSVPVENQERVKSKTVKIVEVKNKVFIV